MPNVPLDTLEGSVSGQLKHTDRRAHQPMRNSEAGQFVPTWLRCEGNHTDKQFARS